MQGLIFLYITLALYQKDYLNVFGGALCLSITFLPFMLRRKWGIHLPWTLNFLIVLSLYLHVGGQIMGWYLIFHPFYDKFGHFIGSATIALLGFASAITLDKFSKIKLNKTHIIFFIIIFTMAIGAFWEIGEFILDQTLGTKTQHGLEDTIYDLIFNLIGGLSIALLTKIYFQTMKKQIIFKGF